MTETKQPDEAKREHENARQTDAASLPLQPKSRWHTWATGIFLLAAFAGIGSFFLDFSEYFKDSEKIQSDRRSESTDNHQKPAELLNYDFEVELSDAHSLLRSRRYDEANREFSRLSERVLRLDGRFSRRNSRLLNSWCTVFYELNLANRRIQCFEENLKVDQVLYGEDSPKLANTLSNLAGALRQAGRLLDAEETALKAIELLEKTESRSVAHSVALEVLGGIKWELGRLDVAIKFFREAEENYVTNGDTNTRNYADNVMQQAYLLRQRGECSEFRKYLRSLEEILAENSFSATRDQLRAVSNLDRTSC